MPDETLTRESAPEFTEQFHKARKQYALWSALLIAWELIGIELKEDAFPNLNVIIKSPQAVPYVLLALMGYFSFRFTNEWYQCDEMRRNIKASRVDYYVAHSIAATAVMVFFVQLVLKIQVIDYIALLMALAFLAIPSLKAYTNHRYRNASYILSCVVLGLCSLYFALISPVTEANGINQILAAGMTVVMAILLFLEASIRRQSRMTATSSKPTNS